MGLYHARASQIAPHSILKSQTVNNKNTRVGNKTDMGLILPAITYHQRAKVGYYQLVFQVLSVYFSTLVYFHEE